MLRLTDTQLDLLAQLLGESRDTVLRFRADRAEALDDLDALEAKRLLLRIDGRYALSLEALAELRSRGVATAESLCYRCEHLLAALKRLYHRAPGDEVQLGDIAREAELPEAQVQRAMRYLLEAPIWDSAVGPQEALSAITLKECVLRFAGLQDILHGLKEQREHSRVSLQPTRTKDQKFGILDSPALLASDLDQPCGLLGRAVIYLDLDHFKAINTRLTEVVVDRLVLPPVHRVLAACVQGYGHAYAEGGDEFTMWLHNASAAIALGFAEAVRAQIAALRFEGAAASTKVTASFGVAHGAAEDAGAVLHERASVAKRSAKERGRNTVVLWQRESENAGP
jgi:diguanylate cyclase (GGDEF)-like protein